MLVLANNQWDKAAAVWYDFFDGLDVRETAELVTVPGEANYVRDSCCGNNNLPYNKHFSMNGIFCNQHTSQINLSLLPFLAQDIHPLSLTIQKTYTAHFTLRSYTITNPPAALHILNGITTKYTTSIHIHWARN